MNRGRVWLNATVILVLSFVAVGILFHFLENVPTFVAWRSSPAFHNVRMGFGIFMIAVGVISYRLIHKSG